jgi:HlyD family secretion protein
MNHKRPPILVIVIVVLAILVGGYYGVRALLTKSESALTASGTIEAVEVTISPEIGGKVTDVLVEEGDPVKAGESLFRLDDTLLQAQRGVAAANLDSANAGASTADAALASAQAQYNLAFDAARAESVAARTASWRAPNPSGYNLPGWYFSQAEAITAARNEVEAAKTTRVAAQTKLADLEADPASKDFVAAEKRLIDARAAYVVAQDVLTRVNAARDNSDLLSSAQTAKDNARTELDDAQSAYDDLKDADPAKNILSARADLAAAQERYETAQDRLLALQTGENSPKLAAAQATLQQAQAAADQAHLAVNQSRASLALLDAQIAKLTVKAPADGVVLRRDIEPGEVVSAGAAAIILGRLETLTITVYIPEDRYGEISLGQTVTVTVDSFPGVTFTARVVHIADQAEFTPRNVQTVAGRKTTVFAIQLQVTDTSGRLKPGMPADVTFNAPAAK